ncbi:cytochrome P450 [Exidia glandulosa HHB12029]|uniref:Cytochrome P450 n=1 Tax=Exidia glandulosa HHB12029 TaxID=1314781 RepID=A0A165HRC0_EXIGL|nr:cytochrome P450 [Exidia glandulosa HHB12029]
MDHGGLPVLALAAAVLALVFLATRPLKRGDYPLPPGPRPLPVLGNMFDIPRAKPWLQFTRWAEIYGPVFTLTTPNDRIIVVNDLETISEGLEKREFADRPHLVVVSELMGFEHQPVFMHDGPDQRMTRKLNRQALNAHSLKAFTDVKESVAARCILELAKDEGRGFSSEIRLAIVRWIMKMVYGIDIHTLDDPINSQTEVVIAAFIDALTPGRYLAETLPFLKYIPAWMPFAEFKRIALHTRRGMDFMCEDPFARVKAALNAATAVPSLTSNLFERFHEGSFPGATEYLLSRVTGNMYGAGVGTTFILSATTNRTMQAAAYAEILRVVGTERLPKLEDRQSMPYVCAVVKETLRWYPAGPLGVSRRAIQDSIIGGYFIPKGSTIMPNLWTISRQPGDPKYPADDFHPERFLSSTPPPDPASYVFGLGRRNCVGQTAAEHFLFVMIASLLASFEILPPLDEHGKEIPPVPAWIGGVFTEPEEFRCRFVPRNSELLQALAARVENSKETHD